MQVYVYLQGKQQWQWELSRSHRGTKNTIKTETREMGGRDGEIGGSKRRTDLEKKNVSI